MPCLFALQICPYNAIKFLPRQQQITEDTNRQLKQLIGKALIKYKLPNKAELKRPDFAGLNLRIRLVCSNAMNLKCEQVLLFFFDCPASELELTELNVNQQRALKSKVCLHVREREL